MATINMAKSSNTTAASRCNGNGQWAMGNTSAWLIQLQLLQREPFGDPLDNRAHFIKPTTLHCTWLTYARIHLREHRHHRVQVNHMRKCQKPHWWTSPIRICIRCCCCCRTCVYLGQPRRVWPAVSMRSPLALAADRCPESGPSRRSQWRAQSLV